MKRLLPFAVILTIAAIASPFLSDIIRELIVLPLLYVFWIGRFLLQAIPQEILWGLFVGLLAITLIISLMARHKSKTRLRQPTTAPQGRVEGWADLLHQAQRDPYFKWRLAQRLQKLTLSTLAHQRSISLKQIRQQLRQGQLDGLPPELQTYFLASLRSLAQLPAKSHPFQSRSTPSELDLDPMRVVYYLQQLNGETSPHIFKEQEFNNLPNPYSKELRGTGRNLEEFP